MNLVFAAGFLVPQRLLGQDYFRGVRSAFPLACFPRVPVAGSIEARAGALAREITAFRFPDPAGPIHIVAHSMGGLDARYLLHRDLAGLSARVASLSTISTPHWGSPIADLLVGTAPGVRRTVYDSIRWAAAASAAPPGRSATSRPSSPSGSIASTRTSDGSPVTATRETGRRRIR